jgi:hypothetical protein
MRLKISGNCLTILLEDRIKQFFNTNENKELISMVYGKMSYDRSGYFFRSRDGSFMCKYPLGFDYLYLMNSDWGKLGKFIEERLHIRFWCYCIISSVGHPYFPSSDAILKIK